MGKVTPAMNRLKNYMGHPEKYWVCHEKHGCLRYYQVIEKDIGVIDRIQPRTYDKAIELGLITHEQYINMQKL